MAIELYRQILSVVNSKDKYKHGTLKNCHFKTICNLTVVDTTTVLLSDFLLAP